MSELLRQKISAVRTRHTWVSIGTGLSVGLTWFVALLTAVALLDWWLDLPWGCRALLLAANLLLAAWCLLRYTVLPIARGGDDEAIALRVERMEPAFASRLIAAVQFDRPNALSPGESASIVKAMVRQTEQVAEAVDFRQVIEIEPMLKWFGGAGVTWLLAAGLFLWGGQGASVLLRRAFLAPVSLPTRTQVELLSGSFMVAQGERAVFQARALGRRPENGAVEIQLPSGRRQTALMHPAEEPGVYTGLIEGVQESFTYRVRLNDGLSPDATVTVTPRPVVVALVCTEIFPAYTGIGAVVRPSSDLSLLKGSRLRLAITASKPLRLPRGAGPVNRVQLFAREGTSTIPSVPLQPDPADPRKLVGELSLPENMTGFSIHLVDEIGLESRNPPVCLVELRPDHPPVLRILSPTRRDVLVTSESTCAISFLAEDDFGIGKVSLKYHIDDEAEKIVPLVIQPGQRQIRGYYPWSIARLAPPPGKPSLEGCLIDFYLVAEDLNTLTGPGVVQTEHYQLRVVSKAEKQAELIARMGESFSTLRDLSDKQEKAAADLGTLILEQQPATRPR